MILGVAVNKTTIINDANVRDGQNKQGVIYFYRSKSEDLHIRFLIFVNISFFVLAITASRKLRNCFCKIAIYKCCEAESHLLNN